MPKNSFFLIFLVLSLNLPVMAVEKGLQAERVWVVIKPLQCLDNPWEKDWLAHHKKKTAKYPQDQEHAVLKRFFAKHGIAILDIRQKPYVSGDPLCMTCGCERGDTLFLLVNVSDSAKMHAYGYDRRLPETSNPAKKSF